MDNCLALHVFIYIVLALIRKDTQGFSYCCTSHFGLRMAPESSHIFLYFSPHYDADTRFLQTSRISCRHVVRAPKCCLQELELVAFAVL
uniref:Putative secreted protein n=1 Tax=Ixodes ricinus TaxID=34613 RepID=A0A6B0UCI9_IXORI